MTTNTSIQKVKDEVKQHSVIPFTARDIECHGNSSNPSIVIANRYLVADSTSLMNTIGLRTNLTRRIFNKPEDNWLEIQNALSNIDKNRRFAGIVNNRNVFCNVVGSNVREETQLDYDTRIDQLLNVMNDTGQDVQDIMFVPQTVGVSASCVNRSQIDCGQGDFWRFGITGTINYVNQTFQQYFLRLVCTNGMSTRENIAYRSAAISKNIAKQFRSFLGKNNAADNVQEKVDAMRNHRASLYEMNLIASCLDKDQQREFFPEYKQMRNDFDRQGFDLDDFKTKQSRFVYSNENLYDVFNRATFLSSHKREELGHNRIMALNKAAGEIFVNGPVLRHSIVDIYRN